MKKLPKTFIFYISHNIFTFTGIDSHRGQSDTVRLWNLPILAENRHTLKSTLVCAYQQCTNPNIKCTITREIYRDHHLSGIRKKSYINLFSAKFASDISEFTPHHRHEYINRPRLRSKILGRNSSYVARRQRDEN